MVFLEKKTVDYSSAFVKLLDVLNAGDIKTGVLERSIGEKSGRQNLLGSWQW